MDAAGRAQALRELHREPGLLVLPNVWDVASARLLASKGFPALATASAAVTSSLGYPDDNVIPPPEMLAAAGRIAASVEVPVSADLEAGYGLEPAALVEGLIESGAVGMNLEDTDHAGGGLVDAERQAGYLQAVVEAGSAAGVQPVLNARVDVFTRGEGEPAARLEEALRRARLYREAGADCIFFVGLLDEPTIRALVDGVDAPVNVSARPGSPSLGRLGELGVARVTFGAGLHKVALAAVERFAARLDPAGGEPVFP